MSAHLGAVAWPIGQLGEAIELLARRRGLHPRNVTPPAPSRAVVEGGAHALDEWVESAAEWLGIEAEPVSTPFEETDAALEALGPALWRLSRATGPSGHCVAVLGGGGGSLRLLTPDGRVTRTRTADVRRAVGATLEQADADRIAAILEAAQVPAGRRGLARDLLLRDRQGRVALGGCWLLRAHPGGSFWRQVRAAGVLSLALRMIAAHAAQYVLVLASWWTIGRAALEESFDPCWLVAWGLLLLTSIPLRLATSWSEARLAIEGGKLFKQRLLFGTLRLRPERIRSEGSGELLGRVVESEAIESLTMSGGLGSVMAIVELGAVAWVLAAGPGSRLHLGLLAAWVGLLISAAWVYFGRRRRWTDQRLALTRDLVERIVGHRTRLAQQAPERWHDGEDVAVERYVQSAHDVDRVGVALSALGRAWIVAGLAGLLPTIVRGDPSPEALAVGLGGVLLADRTLQKLTSGLLALGDAAIAWRVVAPLLEAAAELEPPGVPGLLVDQRATAAPDTAPALIVRAHDLVYRHPGRAEPVLRGCDAAIWSRDRILLEGHSGGGKSTLASLLTGLRVPDAGLLLLNGFDRRTLGGTAWRRRIVSAPQFHENHVLTGTFGFNVLMGRSWPASSEELREAEEVCRELGLNLLLDRMPSGMRQVVGESGWQLSHGERSRLFIARALVQNADLVVLDETFAALDPENLDRALRCVLKRAKAVLVIAHP